MSEGWLIYQVNSEWILARVGVGYLDPRSMGDARSLKQLRRTNWEIRGKRQRWPTTRNRKNMAATVVTLPLAWPATSHAEDKEPLFLSRLQLFR